MVPARGPHRPGLRPHRPYGRHRELGYLLIVVPPNLQRAMITAVLRTLEAINRDRDSGAVRERIVRTAEYLAIGS
ncbi:hypothetical protein ABZ771_30575 [Streptomyces globisporus]|uniref:hypothetical protein n=1 Tax=Streptomyces TaxID=1883 RepID=UPI0004C8FEF7|nr:MULTISPECIES: hypothetical protein [Streptomyces]WSQ93120.1 hypothetical protein OG425_17835 [Streptomyces globisporus]WSU82507.1 hypothetical protein OG215_18685 [Streptomyces globisporus]WSV91086.1 hypothetical protein OG449_18050 [Streptomyces globisporus]